MIGCLALLCTTSSQQQHQTLPQDIWTNETACFAVCHPSERGSHTEGVRGLGNRQSAITMARRDRVLHHARPRRGIAKQSRRAYPPAPVFLICARAYPYVLWLYRTPPWRRRDDYSFARMCGRCRPSGPNRTRAAGNQSSTTAKCVRAGGLCCVVRSRRMVSKRAPLHV